MSNLVPLDEEQRKLLRLLHPTCGGDHPCPPRKIRLNHILKEMPMGTTPNRSFIAGEMNDKLADKCRFCGRPFWYPETA